ncbi:MAG: DUF3131 domain-containing protein [Rhodothermales bacterium]
MYPPFSHRRRRTRRSRRRRRERLVATLTYVVSVVAIAALMLFAWIVYNRSQDRAAAAWVRFAAAEPVIPVRRPQPMTAEDSRWAAAAWQYFERNTSPRTGLPASVAGGRTVTMSDVGSYLMATIAAHRLGIIDVMAFNDRMGRLLATLSQMPLFEGMLPNRAYDIQRLGMIGRDGDIDLVGTGWSGLDISRLLLGFKIVCWEYPYFTPQIRDIVGRWRLDQLADNGMIQGAHLSRNGRIVRHREGRIGYEEYAARVLSLYNLDTREASEVRSHATIAEVDGVELAVDTRPSFPLEGLNLVTSDPFLFYGLELGWDRQILPMAYQVYRVQRQRFATTGEAMAVGAGYLDDSGEPIRCAVIVDNRAWRCVNEAGENVRDAAFFSTGAAIGWAALFETDYARTLRDLAAPSHHPKRGWATGYRLRDGEPVTTYTVQSNALVLEAIHFLARGPLFNMMGDMPSDLLSRQTD